VTTFGRSATDSRPGSRRSAEKIPGRRQGSLVNPELPFASVRFREANHGEEPVPRCSGSFILRSSVWYRGSLRSGFIERSICISARLMSRL
jgi:hypothetical protein